MRTNGHIVVYKEVTHVSATNSVLTKVRVLATSEKDDEFEDAKRFLDEWIAKHNRRGHWKCVNEEAGIWCKHNTCTTEWARVESFFEVNNI